MHFERSLIIGASGGIGSALAAALAPAEVLRLSRSKDGLDLTSEASVKAHLAPLQGPFDLVIIATGALEIDGAGPEKSIGALSAKAMADQFALNAIGPALALKHLRAHLPKTDPSRVICLSARVGSIGDNALGGWISYRASKAALNQIVKTTSIELKRTHPGAICAALHPGTVETDMTRKFLGNHPRVTPPQAARNILDVIARLTPQESGGFFDWKGERVPW